MHTYTDLLLMLPIALMGSLLALMVRRITSVAELPVNGHFSLSHVRTDAYGGDLLTYTTFDGRQYTDSVPVEADLDLHKRRLIRRAAQ